MSEGVVPEAAHEFMPLADDPAFVVTCPVCLEASPLGEWSDVEPGCEVCGSHVGIACPRCDAWFDHVWDRDAFNMGGGG